MDFPTQANSTSQPTPVPGATPPPSNFGAPASSVTPNAPSTPNMGASTYPSPGMASPSAYGQPMSGPTAVPVTTMPNATGMGAGPVAPQSTGSGEIYTMPDKFLQDAGPVGDSGSGKKKGKLWTWILIIVIVLAIAGIVAGVAYYILNGLPETQTTQQTNTVVENTNEAPVNNNANANTNSNENDNTNANDNANENLNDNTNANDNANDNENVNANDNSNVNGNENTNTTTNDNTNTTNTNTNVNVVPSKDTDGDSLSNEEEQIYTTKADKPDTDTDGYNDGAEILAGYDPTNPTSAGRLSDSSLVESYKNKEYGYTILFPSEWIAEEVSESRDNEVFFTPSALDTAGQFVEVIVENNPTGFTAVDWYLDQQPSVTESELEKITSFAGAEGVLSTDGYTAYFANNNYVYAISYQYGNSKELHFNSTFTMIAKSFVLTKAEKKPSTDTDADSTN